MFNSLLNAFSPFSTTPWIGSSLPFPFLGHTEDQGSQFISDHLRTDTGSLHYKLFVPRRYTGAPLPLVVMLHGGGQDANDYALGTSMNALAEEVGCLVVYPEQSTHANWSRCWNWFDVTSHTSRRSEPELIVGVVHKVMDEYSVDRSRLYVAGLSSGGAMAVILGQTYPDLFSAVGCHSGLAFGSASDQYSAMLAMHSGVDPHDPASGKLVNSVPTIVFHGDCDYTVHPHNGAHVVQQMVDCYRDQFDGQGAGLIATEEIAEISGRSCTRVIYEVAPGHTVAEHWTVHGGRHAWSGGNTLGSYTDPTGPDASREMLRFFFNHRNKQLS